MESLKAQMTVAMWEYCMAVMLGYYKVVEKAAQSETLQVGTMVVR